MSPDLTTQAVKAALTNNWQEAIKTNQTLLEENPQDVEALNRLGRAYREAGDVKQAQVTYRRVLKFDRFNPIALKNLKLLGCLPQSSKITRNHHHHPCQPEIFLEEPGKTKLVGLVNIAPAATLLGLSAGNQAYLSIRRRNVIVSDPEGLYLGALPDDLSAKLMKFLKAGNRYEAFIKTVAKNNLAVFIREIGRANRFKNQPSFPGGTFSQPAHSKSEELLGEEEKDEEELPVEEEIMVEER